MNVQQQYDLFIGTTQLARQLRTTANVVSPPLPLSENYFFYESVFLRVFREYENFLEGIFLSYIQEEPKINGASVVSYVKPENRDHARQLITSGMPFLDWTSPSNVIVRAEVYLKNGDPIKLATTSSLQFLQQAKKIRNHISHNSKESLASYRQVVNELLLTTPVVLPPPGELLSTAPNKGPSRNIEILEFYILKFESLAQALTH